MFEAAAPVRHRIVVAMDASPQSTAVLEAAAQLAEIMDADLSAIFVEDSDLLRLAQLPFAREAVPGLSSRRVADAAAMERTLRGLAAQAHAAIGALAGRYRVSPSFTVARGHVLTELLAAAAGADVVALGVRGRLAHWHWRLGSTARAILADAGCSLLMIRSGESLGMPVVALYDDTVGAERALAKAQELARLGDGTLVVVVCGIPDRAASLLMKVRDQVSPDLKVDYVSLDPQQPVALASLLARTGCGVLLVSRDSSLLSGEGGESPLGEVWCPILAVH